MDIKSALKVLTGKAGVSGDERDASEAAAELLKQYAENVEIDSFGNVTGVISSGDPAAETLMLDAHIDRIGMIVTYIDDAGFIKMGSVGGVDLRVMLAQSVTVHGKQKIKGVISTLPPHVSKDHSKVAEIGELAVDVGMSKEQAQRCVSPGDRITIDPEFRELAGSRVSAAAIDDRSGVCAVLAALKMLKNRKLKYNIAVSFSAQGDVREPAGTRKGKGNSPYHRGNAVSHGNQRGQHFRKRQGSALLHAVFPHTLYAYPHGNDGYTGYRSDGTADSRICGR